MPGYLTNKLIMVLFFIVLALTIAISVYRGEVFTAALVSAFISATAVFLSWALGRELDPAHQWSAFISLPPVFIAFIAIGRPSLLALLFFILSCRLLNRTPGRQPFRSDSILLLAMGLLLYFNNFYFALPCLALFFLTDALVKPVNNFQYISALVTSAAYSALLLLVSPEPASYVPGSIPVFYPAAALIIVALSAIYISFVTRHKRTLDDLNREELNYLRVNAARLLIAAWMISEIIFGGAMMIHQIYPMVIVFGGIFLYHLTVKTKERLLKIS